MPETLIITVEPNGRLRFLWHDALARLTEQGHVQIDRASHVEPTAEGRWTADLAPVDGPVLGPFPRRSDALEAEQRWLIDRML